MMNLIEGVILTPLKKIGDDKGMVLKMMTSASPTFKSFGEIYFSITNPGIVKGWKNHLEMIQNYTVPTGEMKFVLYDDRPNSKTRGLINEVTLSLDNYCLLTVPEKIWYSFKATSDCPALIVNCASIPHSPNEVISKNIDTKDIPYVWTGLNL